MLTSIKRMNKALNVLEKCDIDDLHEKIKKKLRGIAESVEAINEKNAYIKELIKIMEDDKNFYDKENSDANELLEMLLIILKSENSSYRENMNKCIEILHEFTKKKK